MCGRFTLTLDADELREQLELGEIPPQYQVRFNIAPEQNVYAVRDNLSRNLELMRWGLVPFWAKDPSIGSRMINARSETLMEKPSFKQSFAKRRCLIATNGFYEWKRFEDKTPSQPYYFQKQDRKAFFFAGLWDLWKDREKGTELISCTIITCKANELLQEIHERMPVILTPELGREWLKEKPVSELNQLLVPFPADQMMAFPVSRKVNSPMVEDPVCIQPQV